MSSVDMALLVAVTIIGVVIGPFVVKYAVERWVVGKRRRYPPVGGTILDQLLNFHREHDFMTDLARKYKTYRMLTFFRNEIYTADPANVEHILKTNFPNYGKGWYLHSILSDLLGEGIFTVDGEKWRRQRSSSAELAAKMLRDFSGPAFRSAAAKLAHIVAQAEATNKTIEIQGLFTKSALDTIFKVLLDTDLDSLSGKNEESTQFSKAFDAASALSTYRFIDIFWKIKKFLNIGTEAKLRNSLKVIDYYTYKHIKAQTQDMDMLQSNNSSSPVMKKVDIWSRFEGMDEKTKEQLKDIIFNFIIAGRDTTAATLSWFFYMMCKHPFMQQKVAEEVREATGFTAANPTIDELANAITKEALDKMNYLHAALTETLRLYPGVPQVHKFVHGDDTWPDGYNVRKGDLVGFQPYAMGRMKFLWGDDAEEFRPERWLNEQGVFKPESPFKFTAFQGGPRICLGREFAYRQMKSLSAVLIGCFIFKLSDEQKPIHYKTMLTLHIEGGLHIRASPRLHATPINASS